MKRPFVVSLLQSNIEKITIRLICSHMIRFLRKGFSSRPSTCNSMFTCKCANMNIAENIRCDESSNEQDTVSRNIRSNTCIHKVHLLLRKERNL